MGCRIMVGHEAGSEGADDMAVFFDSTCGVAFGPTMQSEEEAEAFVKWLTAHDESEPRDCTERELFGFHAQFAQEMLCECGTVRDLACEFCEAGNLAVTLPAHSVHELEKRVHRFPKCKHCKKTEDDHHARGYCAGALMRTQTANFEKFEAGEEFAEEKCMADKAPEPGERFECDYCRRKHAEEASRKAARALASRKVAE